MPEESRKRVREGEVQGHGTSSHPIDLDTDDTENWNSPLNPAGPKRQKTRTGLILNPTARKPACGPLNPVHPSRFPNQRLCTIKAEGKENVPPGRTTFMPSSRSLNLPPPRNSPSAQKLFPLALLRANSGRQLERVRPRNPIQGFNGQQETLCELHRVGKTLSDNLDTTRECQRIMKTLYDADDQVRHPDVFEMLVKLRNDMEESEKGNLKALGDVDHIIGFLNRGGKDSVVSIEGID